MTCRSEQWRTIPGYEGIYEASDCGRIRSAPGKTTSDSAHKMRHWKTRVLKTKRQSFPYRGDERVTLWKDGKPKGFLVSRLVASAWVGCPDGKMTVNHKDGDWSNNHATNLEWVTLAENIRHGFRTGLYRTSQKPVILLGEDGTTHEFCSLSDADRFLSRTIGYTSNNIKHMRRLKNREGAIYEAKFLP